MKLLSEWKLYGKVLAIRCWPELNQLPAVASGEVKVISDVLSFEHVSF
jgi:hypothetical protein